MDVTRDTTRYVVLLMIEMGYLSAERRQKLEREYDELLRKHGRVIRLDPYITSATKILHECIKHNEKHLASPGHCRLGRGLTCCGLETKRRNNEAKKNQAASEYDQAIAVFGKVIRLEPYTHSQKAILHKCLIHGEEHVAMPCHVKQGKGLKCCMVATRIYNSHNKLKDGKSRYDEEIRSFGKVERIEEYEGALTPILHKCLRCGTESLLRPSDARGGKGFDCKCALSSVRERE